MSASERDYTVLEDDRVVKELNRIKFDIKDEAYSGPSSESVMADVHQNWLDNVEEARDELARIWETSESTKMASEARDIVEEYVIKPYKEHVVGAGPFVPDLSFDIDDGRAMEAYAELESFYVDEVLELYEGIQAHVETQAQIHQFRDY